MLVFQTTYDQPKLPRRATGANITAVITTYTSFENMPLCSTIVGYAYLPHLCISGVSRKYRT